MQSNNKNHAYLLILLAFILSACAGQQTSTKSSVMEYLYPKTKEARVEPSTPHLNLPIKVGIAFVPEGYPGGSRGYGLWTGSISGQALTEAKKHNLLEAVAKNFQDLDFVSEIVAIPSAYLTRGGSFSNLSQIKTMYAIDVIALVSYDQVQFTDEGLLSLSYWTIVGAYVVSGQKNDTNTLMDTVVYDIDSKQMLFRAPGTSLVSGKSTPINLSEQLRADSIKGFDLAANMMAVNLKEQVDQFKISLKNDPRKATISHKEGYSGGGAFGLVELALLVFCAMVIFVRTSKRKSIK